MTFADVREDSENTAREIRNFAGGTPVMPETYTLSGVKVKDAVGDDYIKANAFNAFVISADVPSEPVGPAAQADENEVALLPLRVRLRVARRNSPITENWDTIANADMDGGSVLEEFAQTCAIWVRSPHTRERDTNLFTALYNREYAAKRLISAFASDDYLYLDFIVLVADAKSQKAGYTAFCEVVEDDGVPYILIGDGQVDGKWTLSFYIDKTGSNPIWSPDNGNTNTGGGGGGGCWTAGGLGAFGLLAPLFCLSKRLRRRPQTGSGDSSPAGHGAEPHLRKPL
jgi:hypothetical protein